MDAADIKRKVINMFDSHDMKTIGEYLFIYIDYQILNHFNKRNNHCDNLIEGEGDESLLTKENENA